MKSLRKRAIQRATFHLEVHENKQYWTWRFNNLG